MAYAYNKVLYREENKKFKGSDMGTPVTSNTQWKNVRY